MSQKQALAIFATSFLAGLLVTAVVFEPFSITPTTSPYFGFPSESEDLGAQNIPVFMEPGIASKSSTPPVAEIFDLPNSPNELAESFSKTIQEHLQPPSEISTNTISFPQAVMLSTEEILSLENLAKRADNGSVSVTAFNGTPVSETKDLATNSPEPHAIDKPADDAREELVQSPVMEDPSKKTQPVLNSVAGKSEANTTNIATSATAEKPKSLATDDDSTHLETKHQHSTPQAPADRLTQMPTATQGHVSTTTSVESPDSLRSLVSRTQTPPQDQQKVEASAPALSPESSQKHHEAVVKELQAAAVKRDEVENNVPVQSLLTRTLGQSSTKTTSADRFSSTANPSLAP